MVYSWLFHNIVHITLVIAMLRQQLQYHDFLHAKKKLLTFNGTGKCIRAWNKAKQCCQNSFNISNSYPNKAIHLA